MSGIEIPQIALQIAIDQLSRQKEDLRFLRAQAAFTSATSGIIATAFAALLGPTGLPVLVDGSFFWGFSLPGFFVFAAFSGSVMFAALLVTWREKVVFDVSVPTLLASFSETQDLKQILEEVARYADTCFDNNEKVISRAADLLFYSVVLTWCQIPCWLFLISAQ